MNKDIQLIYKDEIFDIVGNIKDKYDSDYYIDNKGYIDEPSGNIYIFKEDNQESSIYPIIYQNNNKIYKVKSTNKDINSIFNINSKYVSNTSLDTIINNTDINEVLYDENVLNDINNATSVYTPTIKDTDDVLKKTIKMAILDTGINIHELKNKMPTRYGLSNDLAALDGQTKMSIAKFSTWNERLGLKTILITTNTVDAKHKLENIIIADTDINECILLTKKEYIKYLEKLLKDAKKEDENGKIK